MWYDNFFQLGPIPETVMTGEYNLPLVALSYAIASLASYVALDMSAHLRKPTTTLFRICWLLGGALIMGAGIWSMHFVGMLAFMMSMPMTYDFFWTGLSMIVAVLTAGAAFLFFTIKKPNYKHYLLSGVILGAAIPTMHYTGMAGMNGVIIHYHPISFSLSILIAIIAATAALWLAVRSDKGNFHVRMRLKFISALIMGLAIVGMHYMGMYAAVFTPIKMTESGLSLDPTLLSLIITTIVVFITLIGLIASTAKYIITSSVEKEKEFLSVVLNNMKGGVIACDLNGKITLANKTLATMFDTSIKNITSGNWVNTLFKPNSIKALTPKENPLYRALQGEYINDVEVICKDQNAVMRSLMAYGQPLRGPENENLGAVVIYYDISKLKENEEILKYNATHDILTQLPNRFLVLDRIKQGIAASNRSKLKTIVIFLDLDNFKFVNDALGHSIGDNLLQVVAKRLKSCLRAVDTVARIGGDEFVIVVPEQKDFHIITLLKKILAIVAEPETISGHELRITCSLGISICPENGVDAETLVKNADAAMYQAKEAGRNTFQFYTTEINTQVTKRFEMENDLRKALVRNEFFLVYQPKLNIQKNQLVGYEALIRWNHPKHGIIPPNDFITIAEETGLIMPIGKWVLKTACAQNKAWQDAGLPALSISVNLSSRQCKDKHFFNTVKEILNETGLEPQFLELELTESLAMSNPAEFMAFLFECKNLGIKTSIDDFGTGYSSLNYLRKFPVNTLKIDRTFINELMGETRDLSIVQAIISLGHSLNLTVIAEGVETLEQLDHLKTNDCDEIQGYYLSRPISAEEIPEFIKKHT